MTPKQTFDVAVVGAGVFGAWTAYQLRQAVAAVVLLDAYGPGNSRASSGGESRIMRLGYGPDEIYTRSAQRSLALWHELFDRVEPAGTPSQVSDELARLSTPLFHVTGVLWLARENDSYCEATLATLERVGARLEKLQRDELQRRYPALKLGPVVWGILEPDSGVLMARQAVKAVTAEARAQGVTYLKEAAVPLPGQGKLASITTASAGKIFADTLVFACGPWLPKSVPALLSDPWHATT